MKKIVALIVLSIFLNSCDVVKQVLEIKALSDCKYKITGYSNVMIADFDIQNSIRNREVNVAKLAGLAFAFMSKNVPLRATVNLNIYNPSQQTASINKLEYRFFIDDTEFFSGNINQQILVKPNQSTDAKIGIQGNVYNLIKNVNAISTFLNKNKNAPNSLHKIVTISLKIKPSLIIAGRVTPYPDYIVIRKEITNKDL
ncbi:MAG: hypothetical protein K2Q03_08775 [Sphingobacteriaceae bacterium]|nr:hypothetical protein [Sphingobacteriaceae bacterium]